MRRLFGTQNKRAPVPKASLDDTSKMLDNRVQTLEERIKKLDSDIMQHQQQLKRLKPGSPAYNAVKQRAMKALKQRKMYEAQRDQMMSQAFNLEQTSFATQTLQDTVTQVQAIKQANQTFKAQFKEIEVDDIEDMQDEMQDMLDQNNEIQELMSRSYEMPYNVDDTELEEELMALEQDVDVEEQLPSYLSELPSTNTTKTPQQMQAELNQPQQSGF